MLSIPAAEFIDRTKCINCGSTNFKELSRGRFSDQPLKGFIEADPSGEDIRPYFESAEWSLVKCSDCTQVFHRRILTDAWNEKRFTDWMTAEAIKVFEDRSSTSVPTRKFEAARNHIKHILRIEKLTREIKSRDEPLRLLDFGSGWGEFVAACQLFGFSAVGVDRSKPRAEESAVKIFPSVRAIGATEKFHVITLFETLEHLDDPSGVLKELSATIVQRGVLILETPDCTGVTDIKSRSDYLKVHPLEHINAFTRDTLISIARRNGFELISKGPSFVTADIMRVAKLMTNHLLGGDEKTTQLYFRKIV
jgi:hypothetical protein